MIFFKKLHDMNWEKFCFLGELAWNDPSYILIWNLNGQGSRKHLNVFYQSFVTSGWFDELYVLLPINTII